MKASLSIALVLSAALLSACGGSSKSKQSVAEFSLTPYEGRTVSSDSIVGTWVSVSEGEETYVDDEFTGNYDVAAKEYFTIRDSGFGYVKDSCESGFNTVSQINGRIEFGGISGTLINNQKISATSIEEGSGYTRSYSYEMVKISDSTQAFGVVNITEAGNGVITENVSCFQQSSALESYSDSNDTYKLEGYLVRTVDYSMIDLQKWSGTYGYTYIYSDGSFFDTDYGDTVDFRVSSNSSTAHNISYNGSNNTEDISGTIQIQLPSQ